MTVNNGYYTVGWSGYPTFRNAYVYQAWGVPTDNTEYTQSSPLMTGGNFYPPSLISSSDQSYTGTGVFYIGVFYRINYNCIFKYKIKSILLTNSKNNNIK
jgi:hypothetical protein